MVIEGDMRERHDRVLAELAEAGMVMVHQLSKAMARTEDAQTQVQLSLAFHRVSRAVRLTIALEFRLTQEARREDRGAVSPPPLSDTRSSAPAPPPPHPRAERADWNEHERDGSEETLDALDELLEADDLDIETVREAVEASIARIRNDIAADPRLASVLATPGAAPPDRVRPAALRSRRSGLLTAAALPGPSLAMPPLTAPASGVAWPRTG